MNNINKNIALLLAWLIATQPLLAAVPAGSITVSDSQASESMSTDTAAGSITGVELTGSYNDRTAEMRAEQYKDVKPGFSEDGNPISQPVLATLPVVDTKLQQRATTAKADEMLRVLIHLNYLPHGEVLKTTMTRFKDEVDEIDSTRAELYRELELTRSLDTQRDSEDYANMFFMQDEQRAALKELNEQNEALSLLITRAISAELKNKIGQSQKPVSERIVNLGGTVEFATIAGNTIVALVPPSAVEDIGKIPGVMRVVEDSEMQGHLNLADTSTMVDPADTTLTGLWDANFTGGIYDPAIIDSGIDLNHPALVNSVTPLRENFYSWYLVAGVGSGNWNGLIGIDDTQGHGTHVSGIVGSKGSSGFSQHKGIAHGVQKMITLKAGWRNTAGTASMIWSDKYNLVDRALFNTSMLQPSNSFNDDVDGMNLSYGGATSLDDTDGSRFWDSVVSSYPDLPVTISAGNSGPSNTLFSDPAVAYNVITVANANDRGTTSRDDDIINLGSTVGPTANNRRKPDLAAPGTSISAPRHNWEPLIVSDNTNKTGTSMAAPMVLGIAMDLADAGVFDEKVVKALLINTAQKNLPGMDIESDADGWDPQVGWGMVNAYAAYFHRFDTFQDSVAPRNTAGEYQLYKGSMRDEGSTGEGRDRATITWNRSATYDSAASPAEFFNLTDLNMRLYNENNGFLIDTDLNGIDNVHQVRVNAGTPDTDVVVNVYAWSSNFANGLETQPYAIATEDGFTRVDRPESFQGIAFWPTSVEPNEEFSVEFWVRNDSELASHSNQFEFLSNNGFTLLSGPVITNVGSIAGEGGNSNHVTYQVRAPAALGDTSFAVAHSHNSYNVPYGDFNWNLNVTVEVDITPPNPNPMTFSVSPFATSTSAISMTASLAFDVHNPIQYFLDFTSSPSGGSGNTDSGWVENRVYTDDGLQTNHQYCYRAWARDNANFRNLTTPSDIECPYTLQAIPDPVVVNAVSNDTIIVQLPSAPQNLTLDLSGYRIDETGTGATSGWQQSTGPFTVPGLSAAALHKFQVRARNGDGIETDTSSTVNVITLANPPAVDSLTTLSETAIRVELLANGNQDGEYEIQNTTAGTTSPWTGLLNWDSTGLTCGTSYNFQARARNQDGIETIIVPLGSRATADCAIDTDGDGVTDDADNCTLVSNPDQRDTNGDGYGNLCDPDLDNNGVVNFLDISIFSAAFQNSGAGLDEDLNGDESVNFLDLVILRNYFLSPPGPSGIAP